MPRPRIPTVKPLLTPMAGRFGTQDKGQGGKTETERSRHRDATHAHRAWYRTARWQKLRWAVLVRDMFTCQMCGRVVSDTSQLVGDHRAPHCGDADLFWDESNVWCICKPCHDSDKQSMEKRGVLR